VLFTGEHETTWHFSRPVFLEPHLVRLFPRQDRSQRLETFSMRVLPEPEGMCEVEDAEGNQACWLWFEGLHETLTITTCFRAQTLRTNPFDYLLAPGAHQLAPHLPDMERDALVPCLATVAESGKAAELGREIARGCSGDSVAFLRELTAWLYGNITVVPRPDPGIQSPDLTLARRSGACRDTTLVFMAACRSVGIPARYLSCYQAGDADQIQRDLHACPEVYLPGAGWRGYDPTLGLAVADAHLALCASFEPALTAPVAGTFRGSGVSSRITHRIDLATQGCVSSG
jgi:transglutaminase-like putative cysteine protease